MSRNEWHVRYRDAVLETNVGKLLERIHAAEKEIAQRLSLGEISAEERRALQEARNSLQMLRTERAELHTDSDRNQ